MNLGGMMGRAPSAPWTVVVTPDRGISFEAPSGRRGSVTSLWLRAGVFGYRVAPRAATAVDPVKGESSAKEEPLSHSLRLTFGGPDPSLTS
jgi:hypothetical protein